MPKQILLIFLTIFLFLKSTQPAKADFSLIWVATGVVIGIMIEKHNNRPDETNEK